MLLQVPTDYNDDFYNDNFIVYTPWTVIQFTQKLFLNKITFIG